MTNLLDATVAAAVRHDRAVVVTAIFLAIGLSWGYLLAGAGMGMSGMEMSRMSQRELLEVLSVREHDMAGMAMMTSVVWTPSYAGLMFLMWWIMMVAMMLPSAAPMILLFDSLNRAQREFGTHYLVTSAFALGYIVTWAAFSLVAVIYQWGLHRQGLLSGMLVATNAVFGGILLLAAGIYQLTPLKHACLRHCRSPMGFISSQWRPGVAGAFRMGLSHGAVCVACCWFLMALMFLGGLMNLYWVAALALFLLLEKSALAGQWLRYLTGTMLLVWGGWLLGVAV